MAAKPRQDGPHQGTLTVNRTAFGRMINTLNNPPKASLELRSFVSAGRNAIATRVK